MKIFNFLRKNLISFLVVALSVVMFFSMATFCWFAQSDGFSTNFKSSTATAYFAGGDGSRKEPYQIKDPVHLYNLAWLQYLGYFNLRSGFNNGRAQSYFKLTADIDMRGYILPPIGTEKYPFIGNFNGDGFAVTNLTVSNGFNDFDGKIYPVNAVFDKKENNGILYYFSAETTSTSAASFLGMFGVTGNYNNAVTNSYTTTVHPVTEKPAEGAVPKENEFYMSEMSVEGFYLDYVKVKSHANTALVGFVAGYVAGDVKNAGVYQSRIEFENAATAKTGDSISAYGLVGNYDSNSVAWEGGWGGSIDMKMLNRRLNYMFTEGNITISQGNVSVSDVYNTNISISGFEFYWRNISGGSNIAYLNQGTIIPLNVNESEMYLDNDTENSEFDKPVTKTIATNLTKELHTNNFYETKQKESVDKNKNTGYLVGAAKSPRARIQTMTGIQKSINGKTDAFDAQNFTLLTTSVDGRTIYRIKENGDNHSESSEITGYTKKTPSELGFDHYSTVREEFIETMTDSKFIHGFHFMDMISVTNPDITTANDVWILGKHYNSYQFVSGGLNFSTKTADKLRLIAGSYYVSTSQALFDLFKVERDDNGNITGFTKIINIYENSSGEISYNTNTVNGEEVFNSIKTNKDRALKCINAAYYYEIPIMRGDYVIGTDSDPTTSSASTAYLMYLDIGADGSSGKHAVSMVDFVNYCDTPTLKQYIRENNEKYPQFDDITAKISAVTAGAYVSFRRKSTAGATFPESKSLLGFVSNGLTIDFTPTGGGKVDQEAENVWQNSG